DDRVATEFLEQSDQRFRLKYLLGGWQEQVDDEDDAFSFEDISEAVADPASSTGPSDFLVATVERVRDIAARARKEVEEVLGPLNSLKGDERDYAIDEIQQTAEQSDDFLDLVADVMEEIEERFRQLTVGE